MVIEVRRATASDADVLHELAAATFGLACPPGTTEADLEAHIAQQLSAGMFAAFLADPLRILLIAESDGKPVGYTMLDGGPVEEPGLAATLARAGDNGIELSKFYLLADAHGTGVAAQLMHATLAAARETGAGFCWLGVNQQNARAGRFYAKSGFEIIGEKQFRVGAAIEDDHVRARQL